MIWGSLNNWSTNRIPYLYRINDTEVMPSNHTRAKWSYLLYDLRGLDHCVFLSYTPERAVSVTQRITVSRICLAMSTVKIWRACSKNYQELWFLALCAWVVFIYVLQIAYWEINPTLWEGSHVNFAKSLVPMSRETTPNQLTHSHVWNLELYDSVSEDRLQRGGSQIPFEIVCVFVHARLHKCEEPSRLSIVGLRNMSSWWLLIASPRIVVAQCYPKCPLVQPTYWDIKVHAKKKERNILQ